MKKTIILICILVVDIWAKDTKDIPGVCQAFLDPDSREQMFVPLETGGESISVDINNDGVDENVSYSLPGHDIVRYNLAIYDKNNKYIHPDAGDGNYEVAIRFAGFDKILTYENKHYIISYKDNNAKIPILISYLNPKNILTPVCKLKNTIKYKVNYHDKNYSENLCYTLREHVTKGEVVSFDIPSKLEANSKEKQYCHSVIREVENVAYFDYNNDTKKEYIQAFSPEYDKSHCYGVLDKSKTKIVSPDWILADYWFYGNGKTYYIHGYKKTNRQTINIYESNESKTVCQFEVEATTSMDNNTSIKIKKDK